MRATGGSVGAVPRIAHALPLLLALGPASSCSRGADPLAWISERSAVVRCASAGKRPPAPVIAGIPAPPAPTGLLARQLDPIALDGLGYLRDGTVCATLEAPSVPTDGVAAGLRSIVALHDTASRDAMRAGGRCTCEIARAQGVRELIAACVQTPTIAGCDENVRRIEVAAAVAPLLGALGDVAVPWVHWRLVGKTDRPGWFADHLEVSIANHDGGSVIHRRGEPVPTRTDAVVRAMLEVDHVVAVVRQDGGRALLVAREQDGLLILDHIRQPPASTDRGPLLARLEQAQVGALVAMLTAGVARPALVAPTEGTFVEIDRPLLEELDRAAAAAGVLLEATDPPPPPGPPVLFDRVAYVAPYGEDGAVLRVEHALSVDGLAWAQTLGDAPLVGGLDGLGLQPDIEVPWNMAAPRIVGEPDTAGRWLLRGTATGRWGIHGVHRFPALASLLEIAAPGSLGGQGSSWRIDWPGAPLPSELDVEAAPFEGLRTLAGRRAYRLESSMDPARTRLTITVSPR